MKTDPCASIPRPVSLSRRSLHPLPRNSGLALVLVIIVVMALVIIATPFVLSMILQEKTGTAARYESQADYGADGARNYALWRLMHGLDPMERRHPAGAFSSPYSDAPPELDIRMNEAYLRNATVLNPKGAVWGVTVQDEQGKLNVRSAPDTAVARLLGLLRNQAVDPKDYLTIYSGRDASWAHPRRIRGVGNIPIGQNQTVWGTNVDNSFPYGPGARARASKPGQSMEVRVTGNQGFVTTDPDISGGYADGVIEVEVRHPVNLNTARRETLIAVFEGLTLPSNPPMPDDTVDRGAADEVVRACAGRRVERLEEFYQIVDATGLSKQQKTAVKINAAAPTHAVLQGSGTVPLCFVSYDVYSLEATSSMNNPAGVEVSGRGFREVASVSPPMDLTRYVESQFDFDEVLARHGYRNRMVSFPMVPPAWSDTALKPQQGPQNEAYLQIETGRDQRGNWAYAAQLHPREHFDDKHEGKKLNGGAETYPWNQVFTTNPSPPPGPPQQHPDTAAGGLEFWARFDGGATTLFDIREREYSNRVSLSVEGGDLVFTVCDATIGTSLDPIDNGAAEVRMPFMPQAETWHHFGAYWDSTRYGRLALLVDGFAHPQQKFRHVNPEKTDLCTKLGGAMTQASTSISLLNDSFLPGYPVPLLIGDEVVVYDKPSGNLARGARGTLATAHPAQAAVSLFGYSSKVRNMTITADFNSFQIPMVFDRITTGGGSVLYNFGQSPSAAVAGDIQDSLTLQWYLDGTATTILVTTANIMDYPDQGYIMVDNEVIYYTNRSVGGQNGKGDAKFTGCTRAQHGTLAARHDEPRPVFLWCVPVNDTTNYLSPTIIQVGDEWFGPVQRDPMRPTFWIPFVNQGNPVGLMRGGVVYGSPQLSHSVSELVLPTFVARESDPNVNRQNLGRPDRVTLTDASNGKEQQRIRHVNPWNWPGGVLPMPPGGAQIAGFFDNVSQPYTPDDLHVRVLKFPSGELLGLNWLQTANPNFSIGPMSATIDEIKFIGMPQGHRAIGAPIGTTDTTLPFNGGMAGGGGCVKVGNEYIGYGRYAQGSLTQVKRGWLNSGNGEVHDAGESGFYLSFLPISSLQGDLSPSDSSLSLTQGLQGQCTPGYVVIDNELLLLEWNYGMPARWDGSTGLFRGMFGTAPAAHPAATSLVYALPWRFYDTYKAQEFDNRMVFFQWSTNMDLARWRTVRWTQEVPQQDGNIVVHAVVRLDGKGELYDPPAVGNDTLVYDFTGGQGRINRTGFQKDAGQFDIRFFVEYRPGSFDVQAPWAAHSWKRTPKIKEVRVEYDRPSKTLYHEDR